MQHLPLAITGLQGGAHQSACDDALCQDKWVFY